MITNGPTQENPKPKDSKTKANELIQLCTKALRDMPNYIKSIVGYNKQVAEYISKQEIAEEKAKEMAKKQETSRADISTPDHKKPSNTNSGGGKSF